MNMLKTWINGEDSAIVQKIIEHNFRILGKYLPNNVLSLPRSSRLSLTIDYLANGLIVYDTTDKCWYQYNNGCWEVYNLQSSYELTVTPNMWKDGKIIIPYETHLLNNPSVSLFMRMSDGNYQNVLGGVYLDNDKNITLQSDLAFTGKVIVK